MSDCKIRNVLEVYMKCLGFAIILWSRGTKIYAVPLSVRPCVRLSVCPSSCSSLRFSVNHLSAVFCQLLCFVLFYSFLCQNFHDKLKFSLNYCVSATVKRDELFKTFHNEVPVNAWSWSLNSTSTCKTLRMHNAVCICNVFLQELYKAIYENIDM